MTENLLAHSTSPYLLQHRDNPVHWQPWGPEALAQARERDCPILLSVGYAACHWCHVMAHESFENDEIAALMNEHFVNVKVDREERPDIDAIYMAALHMLGEHGGWPMTMFLNPNGELFWGGTYFPPEPRWGRPSFPQVLKEIARIYREERQVVTNNTGAITSRLGALAEARPGEAPGTADADKAADALLGAMDMDHGGLKGAPKFPNCGIFDLLLRSGIRRNDDRFTDAVAFALERICEGGIYDHLGGGFARYSVDHRWLAPHFEKMLYDNAQLIDMLTTAWQLTRKPLFEGRIAETVGWLEREIRLEGGGFASSLDADSEGEEGKFYVWSAAEIEEVLGADDAAFFAAHYDVTPQGNWEGKVILNRLTAEAFSPAADERLAPLRDKLLVTRAGRVRPGLDDKVLADWNGLMIDALARAAATFANGDWLKLAEDAFRFITDSMSDGPRLRHAWRDGAANIEGLATDYANMAAAAVTLYEATSEPAYLDHALGWLQVLDDSFASESGGYYMSGESAHDLIVRPLSAADEATPAANAVITMTRTRLAGITGDETHAQAARKILSAFAAHVREQPFSHARLLAAAEAAENPIEIVVAGSGANLDNIWQAAWRTAAPSAVRLRIEDDNALPESHAAALPQTDGPVALVCAARTCSLPLSDATALASEIEARRIA